MTAGPKSERARGASAFSDASLEGPAFNGARE